MDPLSGVCRTSRDQSDLTPETGTSGRFRAFVLFKTFSNATKERKDP